MNKCLMDECENLISEGKWCSIKCKIRFRNTYFTPHDPFHNAVTEKALKKFMASNLSIKEYLLSFGKFKDEEVRK